MPSEIVFPETEPETEWVRGRALQKVSPTYWHGLAQRRIATLLGEWAETFACGRVATEWRFRVTPPGEITRPLVPDVAYVSYAALPKGAAPGDVSVPLLAPTLAVEIRSPDDRDDDVADKVASYLAAGSVAVFVVDPQAKTAAIFDADGERFFIGARVVHHDSLPGFAIDLGKLFRD